MKKKLIFIITGILLLSLLFSQTISAFAENFNSYAYNSEGEVVRAPAAVRVSATVTGSAIGTDDFKAPSDLYISEEGMIYIADRGNNRIVILNSDGDFVREITSFKNGDKTETFNSPSGVFVTKDNVTLICDTLNGRIVRLDKEGRFIDAITLTAGESLPPDFVFSPSKVGVDASGRIFVVSAGFNNGILEFTASGDFVRYMGASKVTLTPMQLFWRMFSTKEQREKTSSNVSTEYNNVEVDDGGFLLVTSSAFTYYEYASGAAQPIRKLNSKGSDVLSRVGNPSGELDYPDARISTATYKGPSTLVDVCTLPYGNYAVLDQNRGRVFAYNADGEMMYEFAGPGDISGGLTTPTALDYVNGRFYVTDSAKNQINIYTLTEYGELFNSVAKARQELDYEAEENLWNVIVKENANCELAMRGLGNAAYRKQDMKTAMHYFKEAEDRDSYSKAFVFVRRQWIEKNAVWMLLIAAAAVALIYFLKKYWKKLAEKKGPRSYIGHLEFSNYVIFHPINGFWELKRENRGGLLSAITFLVCAIAVRVAGSVTTGFIFNYTDLTEYSLFSDALLVLGLFALWVISQWCVTVLMNGEGNFKNIFISTSYSLTPFIWLNLFAILFSQVLSLDEAELHSVLIAIGLIYTVFLLFMSVMSTHNYSAGKTFIVVIIMIVVILLIVFVGLLLITLTQQMIAFVQDLYNEITLRI